MNRLVNMVDSSFKFPVTMVEILIPSISSGVLLAGGLFFLYIYINTKNKTDMSVSVLAITGFIYSFCEIFVVYIGGIQGNFNIASKIFYLQHIMGTFFIPSFSFYLLRGFGVKGYLIKLQKIVTVFFFIFFTVVLVFSIFKTDLFLSVTEQRDTFFNNIIQSDTGRGTIGPLYRLRDLFLSFFIVEVYYVLIVTFIKERSKRTIVLIVGISLLLYGALEDIAITNIQKYILFSEYSFSRVTLGMTLFITSAMALAAYDFLSASFKVKENEKILQNARERDQKLIAYVNEATTKINSAMSDVFEGNKKLSEYTENEASRLENVSASMKEISYTMRMTAEVISKASQTSVESQSVIENGVSRISSMVSQIDEISSAGNKILDIAKIIGSIAFQTNILALNAAVEAARAGEQGRGFAVVASEVRNLAQTTSASASDVGHLIDEVVSKISVMHKEAEVSRDILSQIKEISISDTEALRKTNDTIKDQYMHVEVINGEIEEISNIVQENTRLAENVSERSQETFKEANDLSNIVSDMSA